MYQPILFNPKDIFRQSVKKFYWDKKQNKKRHKFVPLEVLKSLQQGTPIVPGFILSLLKILVAIGII